MTSEWPKQAQQAGLSQPIVRQIATLSELLAEVAEQTGRSETLALFEEFRSLCAAGSPHGDYSAATAKIQGLSASRIEALLRMGLTWFQLLNAAEKQEISRINRERRSPGGREPPSESIDEAVRQLKEAGCSLEEAEDCLRRLDIRPTLERFRI